MNLLAIAPPMSNPLARGRTDIFIMQRYQPIKIIGKGSFGEVTKAVDIRTNKFRAIKKIKKSALQKE
jgi:serine/threonine protein kinase